MKYKVGDKVKVISELTKDRYDYGVYFDEEMDKHLGKKMTIERVYDDTYALEEDDGGWFWSEDMIEGLAKFTKSDLKDNHIVVYKSGEKTLWEDVCLKKNYTENLIYADYDNATINEVYEFDKLVWKREKQILDEVEKKYLSDVIRPFRDRVRHFMKIDNGLGIFISIRIKGESSINLPYLKNKNMYKGMELNKEYSLKELGLED